MQPILKTSKPPPSSDNEISYKHSRRLRLLNNIYHMLQEQSKGDRIL